MQKNILIGAFLIASHVAIFFGGSFMGGKISKNYLYQEFEKANASIILSHYVQFRDFAKSIKTGELDNARCSAELGASSNLDDVKACLANDYCKAAIEKEVPLLAPEITSGSPLSFDYKKKVNGVRRCE